MTGLVTAFGSGAMTNSIEDIATKARSYFIIGSNTTEQHPVIGMLIKQAVLRGVKLVLADPRSIELSKFATIHLKQKPGTDIALLNGLMNVILSLDLWDKEFVETRTEGFEEFRATIERYNPEYVEKITGVPARDIVEAAKILGNNRPSSLLYAMGITQHTYGHQNVLSCANLQMLLGNMGLEGGGVNPLRGQNNVQGACDVGGLPNVFSGYQKVTDDVIRRKFEEAWGVPLPSEPGLTIVEMVNAAGEGKIKGMFIVGENPMVSDPDINHVRESLEKLDFLVVQDIFLTETAKLADVVLPGRSFAEKDGTFTNTERRIQRVRKAIELPGETRDDWKIVCDLATRMGYPMHYDSPAEIMNEIASLTPIYGGIRYNRLDKKGLQWPCPDVDHPGTKILHQGEFSRGLGKFSAVDYISPAEEPDEEFPLVFTTGRVLYQFHTRTMTGRSAIDAIYPEGLVELNPADAKRYNISDGDLVRVTSRRGRIIARAEVTDRPKAGVVFMTFHFADAAANILTNPALDPIAKIPEYKFCAVRIEPARSPDYLKKFRTASFRP